MLLYICKKDKEKKKQKVEKQIKHRKGDFIMEKITKKAMYGALVNYANGGELVADTKDGQVTVTMDQLAEFANREIELLDNKAAKAKVAAAKKKTEGDELQDAVEMALSTSEFEPIAAIAEKIESEDVTVSKVTYRLTQLVKNGVAEKQEIAVPTGEGNKTRKIMGYRLVDASTEVAEDVEYATAGIDEE